jgi:hypothetical protein
MPRSTLSSPGAVLGAVGLITGALAMACGPAASKSPTPTPSAVSATTLPAASRPATIAATVKPLGEHVIAEWKVNSPAFIFIGSDSVWVPGHGDGKVTQIDPASNEVIAVVSPDKAEQAPTAEGFGSVWIATRDNKLNRVDSATGDFIASIALTDGFQDIGNAVVIADSWVWVYLSDKGELIKVDPATNRIVSRTPWTKLIDEAKAKTTVPSGKGPDFMWMQIAGDEGGGGLEKGLLRLDPKSGAGLTFLPWAADQNGDGSLTVTDDAVWYGAGGHIYRIDIATNQIEATYPTEPGIIHLAIGFGSVWVANYNQSLVQRLDVAL